MSSRPRKARTATTRRPSARRRTRRPSKRRQRPEDRLIEFLVTAALALGLVVAVVNWLLTHWWILFIVGVLAVLAGGGRLYRKKQKAEWEAVRTQGLRYGVSQLDALHHARFEGAVRDLMRRDGCRDAVRVGGGGDLGADVKATDPYGRRWVIQCKHRRDGLAGSAVGTPDLQVLNGTARQIHGADVAVIVTNGRVTAPAVAFAKQQRLHVVDRHTLAAWASGSRPLWELLRAVPPPRRPTAQS
ncbi:restriction endonuclease [Streptomyces sp. WAC05374]|uniref:restriction endonuclease n=1 Tax=Streptomyces sp. WAC05374 TaxID=2487420 RepID=UPI000F86E7D3|nr:restriction endonuclease [Streptomyces sp. WAC05374]RST19583.1 restriction endonuclease [Streptomyces sp. WAC05374]TDF50080.1 restriction endonuclease [Streptomyces sp. WAC05374]TDF57806.1 restriction endonuclease [Streptomyces sp. WAC05374]TDF60334.1 restriction endonuclease [Streptomyces sp. WAC05374]